MTRRLERVNELLRAELSALLQKGAKDPRLGAAVVSVTEVSTSPDLRHARVYVSILGSPTEQEQALRGLHSAAGFLHHELQGRLELRRVPVLSFIRDDSIERGDHLLRLMKEVASAEGGQGRNAPDSDAGPAAPEEQTPGG